MHHFTIRDIENLSGIKAHTLRMWEQRYGLCVCKRKESLHRYYDNDDLKHILRIAYLYHNGTKISRIVQFSQQEIIELASRRKEHDEYEVMVNQLIEASVDYNDQQFEQVFNTCLRSMGLEKSMEKVVYPFLDTIGRLWMTNHVMPAQEHFCSHLIHRMLIAAINSLPAAGKSSNRYLLFTPPGEEHDLSLLFVQYIIKKQGHRTVLLGRNISIDILQAYCAHRPVSHLYFHLITNFIHCNASEYLNKLSMAFPDKQILASGPALKDIEDMPANVQLLRSVPSLVAFDFGR